MGAWVGKATEVAASLCLVDSGLGHRPSLSLSVRCLIIPLEMCLCERCWN